MGAQALDHSPTFRMTKISRNTASVFGLSCVVTKAKMEGWTWLWIWGWTACKVRFIFLFSFAQMNGPSIGTLGPQGAMADSSPWAPTIQFSVPNKNLWSWIRPSGGWRLAISWSGIPCTKFPNFILLISIPKLAWFRSPEQFLLPHPGWQTQRRKPAEPMDSCDTGQLGHQKILAFSKATWSHLCQFTWAPIA